MICSLFCIILFLGPMDIEWTSLPTGQIAVEWAGDVNGDGTEDCFTSASEYNASGVFCLDGLTGEILWQNDTIPGVWFTDCLRTIGDVNLDGIQDVAAGTGLVPAITVFSGADGTILWSQPQEYSIRYLEKSTGPDSGDIAILALGKSGSDWCHFYGLDGLTGTPVWNQAFVVSTLDDWMRVTDADLNGNGWSEMAYSVDRGSAMSGGVGVRDGYTGESIYGCSACYFPTMDISDTPLPCLAVVHFGWKPDMWVDDLLQQTTLWTIEDLNLPAANLTYIPNVSGPSWPYPELIAWSSGQATIIYGNAGNFQDSYFFPSDLVALSAYEDSTEWKLVALTASTLHCPVLTSVSPQTDPFVPLPSAPATDFCIIDSDLFPSPMVCVAMDGPAPGVCGVRTSWQVYTQPDGSSPVIEVSPVNIVLVPSVGGIPIMCNVSADILVMNIAGRQVSDLSMIAGEESFIQLPPGVYSLVDRSTGSVLQRAVVLE